MEKKLSLPCDVVELQKKDVDWKTLTNGFDYDTVKRIIELWKNYGERRIIARMIGSQMSVNNLRDITTSALQPVLDLLNMYRYEEGSREYKLLEGRLKYDEEKSRREKWERLQEENKRLKAQVEKLKDENSAGQTPELKRHIVEIIDDPDSHLHVNLKESIIDQCIVEDDVLKKKHEEVQEEAFNGRTGMPCFTNRQMGVLMTAVGRLTEKDNPPRKTTIGDVVEKISGYASKSVNQNMKGAIPKRDIETIVSVLENKFPNLAAEIRKL